VLKDAEMLVMYTVKHVPFISFNFTVTYSVSNLFLLLCYMLLLTFCVSLSNID